MHIGGPALDFACKKKRLYCNCRRHIHIYTILYLLKKNMGEIFMKADSKNRETQKLVSIKKVVEIK